MVHKKFLKGQGAAEYLILLAMVLIIALIGVIMIGGFTIGGAEAMRAESAAYWTGPVRPFQITEWAQIGSTMYMTLKNTENKRIILQNITLGNVTATFSGGWTFGAQASKNISITGLRACNATSYDEFEYGLNISYDTSDITGLTQYGAKPLAGKCYES